MIGSASKALFSSLAQSTALQRLASKYGMASPRSFARRFIAGETIDEAISAARTIQAQRLFLTLDYLGESVRTLEGADAATREYLRMIDVIVASGIERNVSLKLTQLGLEVDKATCVDNLRRILEPARHHGFFVRIDMENSPYTDVTLDIFETLWQQQYRNVGVVLQSALYRSEQDTRRVLALGARIRLVKGAYKEPKAVAYQLKAEVDEAFVRLMKLLLDSDTYPAIATHDQVLIDDTRAYVAELMRQAGLELPDLLLQPLDDAQRILPIAHQSHATHDLDTRRDRVDAAGWRRHHGRGRRLPGRPRRCPRCPARRRCEPERPGPRVTGTRRPPRRARHQGGSHRGRVPQRGLDLPRRVPARRLPVDCAGGRKDRLKPVLSARQKRW